MFITLLLLSVPYDICSLLSATVRFVLAFIIIDPLFVVFKYLDHHRLHRFNRIPAAVHRSIDYSTNSLLDRPISLWNSRDIRRRKLGPCIEVIDV